MSQKVLEFSHFCHHVSPWCRMVIGDWSSERNFVTEISRLAPSVPLPCSSPSHLTPGRQDARSNQTRT